MSAIPKEALDEYVGESMEMSNRVSVGLGLIERNSHNDETINSIYRDIHSIKGSSYLFGFRSIGNLAHAIETTLEPVRDHSRIVSRHSMDLIFEGLDLISQMISNIQRHGTEGQDNFGRADQVVQKILAHHNQSGAVNLASSSVGIERDRSIVAAKPDNVQRDESLESSTIRIPVDLVDNLMNMVSELVLVRNQFLQLSPADSSNEFKSLAQRLNVITSELQVDVMKTRMQPVGNTLSKFHRIVRDLAKDLGKLIEYRLIGIDTELDKALIEALSDPVNHIIRNCADHGLESPEERQRSGKPELGLITATAYHKEGFVFVEISDDGRGIVPAKIARKAIERGVISEVQANKMSVKELQELIFHPGFTTAESISSISGRGIGMDVVKTNIQKIGGSVELSSVPGKGTTIKLKLPLTLAIIHSLVIKSCGQLFAIAQSRVIELVRVDPAGVVGSQILEFEGGKFIRRRDQLVPVVNLGKYLDLRREGEDVRKGSEGLNCLVITQTESGIYAFLVDEIKDSVDIVVKPLVDIVRKCKLYSGATILGSGDIVLILDVNGIASGVSASQTIDSRLDLNEYRSGGRTPNESAEYLLVDLARSGKYAIPLCLVSRIEEFEIASIERVGKHHVVRYQGGFLPILSIDHDSNQSSSPEATNQSRKKLMVLVIQRGGKSYGLKISNIIDVAAIDSPLEDYSSLGAGFLGSIIYGPDVLSVIDVLGIVDDFRKGHLLNEMDADDQNLRVSDSPMDSDIDGYLRADRRKHSKILLVEDTGFFRKHIRKFFENSGYMVLTAENGEEALSVLDASRDLPNVIITDIEMPICTGFELLHRILASDKFAKIPVIALTTKYSPEDLRRGEEAGFAHYLEKFRGEEVLSVVDAVIQKTNDHLVQEYAKASP